MGGDRQGGCRWGRGGGNGWVLRASGVGYGGGKQLDTVGQGHLKGVGCARVLHRVLQASPCSQ